MKITKEFKETYNALLLREAKGRELIDGTKGSKEEKERWLNGKGGYMDICEKLGKMIVEYKKITGETMSDEIALGGFK